MASLQNISTLLLDSNLLAYYKLDGNSNDYKNTYNGTDTSMSYVTGKYNQAGLFSGTGYISNTGIPTLGNFTISFWIKPINGAGAPLCIRQLNHIWYSYNGSSTLSFKLYNGTSEIILDMPVVDNNYQHIVVTRSGSTVNCYVDNVLSTSGETSGMFSTAYAGDYIGCFDPGVASGNSNGIFTGEIDDLCIFSRALMVEEIGLLYTDIVPDFISNKQSLGEYRNGNIYTTTAQTSSFPSSMVFYMNLDNNTNVTYQREGTNITPTATNPVYTTSVFTGGTAFSNTYTNYINLGNVCNFEYNQPFTLMAWINNVSASNRNYVSKQGGAALNYIGYGLGTNGSGKPEIFINNSATGKALIKDLTTSYRDTTKRHWCFTYDGSNTLAGMSFYINGVLQTGFTSSNGPQTSSIITTANFQIGGRYGANNLPSGSTDDVAVFDTCLTAAEVNAIATAGKPIGEIYAGGGETIYTYHKSTLMLLNFNSGTTADLGGGITGITTNNLTYEYDKSRYKKCAKFNGTSSYINYSGSTLTDFTFSTYVKMNTGLTGNNYLFNKANATDNSNIDIYVSTDGLIHCNYYNGTNYPLVNNISITDNKWHNVIITRSGSTISIYIDGKLDGVNSSVPTTAIGNTYNNIGRQYSGTSYLNGWMDEIIVETEVWNPIKIKKYYTNSLGRYAII